MENNIMPDTIFIISQILTPAMAVIIHPVIPFNKAFTVAVIQHSTV